MLYFAIVCVLEGEPASLLDTRKVVVSVGCVQRSAGPPRLSTRFSVTQSADPAPCESSVSPEAHRTKCRPPPLDIFMSVTTPFSHFLDLRTKRVSPVLGVYWAMAWTMAWLLGGVIGWLLYPSPSPRDP